MISYGRPFRKCTGELRRFLTTVELNNLDPEAKALAFKEKRPCPDNRVACWLPVVLEMRDLIDSDRTVHEKYDGSGVVIQSTTKNAYSFIILYMGIEDIKEEYPDFYWGPILEILAKYDKYLKSQKEYSVFEYMREVLDKTIDKLYRVETELKSVEKRIKSYEFTLNHLKDTVLMSLDRIDGRINDLTEKVTAMK